MCSTLKEYECLQIQQITSEEDLALGWFFQTSDQPEQRRLACHRNRVVGMTPAADAVSRHLFKLTTVVPVRFVDTKLGELKADAALARQRPAHGWTPAAALRCAARHRVHPCRTVNRLLRASAVLHCNLAGQLP